VTAELPLAGVRVVEFVHMVMGPSCGLVLGDLGAEVIKVEPVSGDNTRRLVGAGSGFFVTFNRNKKSLAVDVKSPAGLEVVQRLLASADVVTENFRPGAMERLGLDYESVRELRPDIIYCSLKGFLPGPYEHRAALDEVVQMMGGLAYMTGPPGRPLRAGSSVNDIMGGMFAVIAILSALRQRDATGRGQKVGSALYENNVLLVAQHMMQFAVSGEAAAPMPARTSAWAIYDVFDTADGEQLFVGVVTDTQWQVFCERFELAELFADPTLTTNHQRVQARDRLIPAVASLFAGWSKADLMDVCESIGLPYAPITRPEDLFDDPQLNAPGAMLSVTHPEAGALRLPALPMEMSGRRLGVRLDVPRLGEHSEALLQELGYADDEIAALKRSGVIGVDRNADE
jgi:crotonobetainyl-CoA:carnitine CoA-transferase CaiB-like acyl-CoA transferase